MVKLFFVRPSEIRVHLTEEVGKYLILTVSHSRKYERTCTMYGVMQGDYDGVPFSPDISLGIIPSDDGNDCDYDKIPMIHMMLGPYDNFYFERRCKDTEELIFIPKSDVPVTQSGLFGASSDLRYNKNVWPAIKDGTLWTLGD